MVKFLRRDWSVFSRLGRRRKNKQKWRNPTGRHNKIREHIAGHPVGVRIGYRTEKVNREKINNQEVIKVNNVRELEKVGKNQIALLSNIGKKKKIEIAKKAEEKGIKISNLNTKKILNKKKEVKK